MGIPKTIPAMIFFIPKSSFFWIAFTIRITAAIEAAMPNKLPEKIETSFLGKRKMNYCIFLNVSQNYHIRR